MQKNNSTLCCTCNKDLAECETVVAAEGMLFCSRTCGILKYRMNAVAWFEAVHEEVATAEIGLEVHKDELQ